MGFLDKIKSVAAGLDEPSDDQLPAPLRDRGREKLLSEGTPGAARVHLDPRYGTSDISGDFYRSECRLEVRPADGTPYELSGMFSVVANFKHWATPGIELPVKIDPADSEHVAIDWPAFDESGGRAAAERAAVGSGPSGAGA